MQAASARPRAGSYLPFQEGQPLLPPRCSAFVAYLDSFRWDQTGTPFVLDALLLLLIPLAFTFTQLVALPLLADAVHQLPIYRGYPRSFFNLSLRASFSVFKSRNISFKLSAFAVGTQFLNLFSLRSSCLS